MSATAIPDDQVLAQYCTLELTGVSAVFDSVSGFSISIELLKQKMALASGETAVKFRGGIPKYGDLSCTTQLSKTDKSLFTWWDEVAKGIATPKDGTMSLFDSSGIVEATFTIVGALLTSLEIESMSVSNPDSAGVTAVFNCLSYKRMS